MRRSLPVVVATVIAGITLSMTAGTASAAIRPNGITQFCDYTAAEPEISYGSTGTAVKEAQCELNSVVNSARTIAEDGIFGTDTRSFTETFQSCAGLSVDGIIGPRTWAALDSWSNEARSCG